MQFDGFAQAGASVSVPFGTTVTGPSSTRAMRRPQARRPPMRRCACRASLDAAKVTGHIVVCDRGGNARAEKSQVVKDAGGIGMVLVNVPGGADSLDNDFHAVPTVHLASATAPPCSATCRAASIVRSPSSGRTRRA